MEYTRKNWIGKPLPAFRAGDVVENCNLLRVTEEAIPSAGVTFIECNLTNCILDATATATRCLRLRKQFCYWLHPGWGLPTEPENCPHVVDTDVVTVDGAEVESTEYIRDDTVIGKY